MVVNMLKAVSQMLGHDSTMEAVSFRARVSCAKTMLDEIIKGLTHEPKELYFGPKESVDITPMLIPPSKEEPPKPPKKVIPQDKRQIVVGDSGRITSIRNYPLDGKIELDGRIMTHKDAIGKKFNNGRFVE